METIIRDATIDDLEKIQALNLKLFEKEHTEYDPLLNLDRTFGEKGTAYYQKRISQDDGCTVVAVVDNEIVGYLCGGIAKAESYRSVPIIAELENTFVIEDFRSKGIGKQLFEKFIERCRTKNIGRIKVTACAENEKAIKFYRANKFIDFSLTLEREV